MAEVDLREFYHGPEKNRDIREKIYLHELVIQRHPELHQQLLREEPAYARLCELYEEIKRDLNIYPDNN